MNAAQETEITLGIGKLLLLFFGLVALCAVFFALGYNLGRSAASPASAESTPAAADTAKQTNRSGAASGAKATDLTFYKTVEQNDSYPQLSPAQGSATASNGAGDTSAQSTASAPDTTTLPSANSYYVQVAAVSKQEDAEALVEALRRKQYPAFTASGSSADRLFHVQVGPYNDIKEAEIMRAKLINDGYNPILKK